MKSAEVFKFLFKWAWVITVACIALFFVTALSVYVNVEPSSVPIFLTKDDNDSWIGSSALSTASGDLEQYPYVTKVYSYGTNDDSLDISFVSKDEYGMEYGIVKDDSAGYNYYVECFVYSNIADKKYVKSLWNISVQKDEALTLTQTHFVKRADPHVSSGDIVKGKMFFDGHLDYRTFMRITVKPGYTDVHFSNNEKTDE